MKTLKRSECSVLPLVLKTKWYRMIECGEKREREAAQSAPGNAAAMREALDKAECVLLVAARFATDNAFTDAEARENLRDVDWDGALTEIDAALAAPARNCDILSEEAANKAWDDYRHANVLPRGGWDFRHIIAWLFAPAEGGAE